MGFQYRKYLPILTVFYVFAVIGCRAPQSPELSGYANVVVQPANLGLKIPDYPRRHDGMEGATVKIEAHVISGEVGFWEQHGMRSQEAIRVVSPEMLDELLNLSGDGQPLRKLSLPEITLQSGQKECAVAATRRAFVQDIDLAQPQGSDMTPPTPIVGFFHEGCVVEVAPVVENAEIALSLDVQLCFLVGWRQCTAVIEGGADDGSFTWMEPVLLMATVDPEALESLRIKDGETLLVRLKFLVRQGSSNARAYARNGEVSEKYVPVRTGGNGASMLKRDRVLLLTARAI